MNIIGLAGTNGAGKSTIGQMLAERHDFLFVSVSDFLRQEAKSRGRPVEREALRTISAEWRRRHGLGVLVEKAIEIFNNSPGTHAGLAVESIRNIGEAKYLKSLGGRLVWVDADPRVRHKRASTRRRTAEDRKTYQAFLVEERAETHRRGDGAALDMAAVKNSATFFQPTTAMTQWPLRTKPNGLWV
jgi:dephospho-CoA kinase